MVWQQQWGSRRLLQGKNKQQTNKQTNKTPPARAAMKAEVGSDSWTKAGNGEGGEKRN
jgi:hypothetical protein